MLKGKIVTYRDKWGSTTRCFVLGDTVLEECIFSSHLSCPLRTMKNGIAFCTDHSRNYVDEWVMPECAYAYF